MSVYGSFLIFLYPFLVAKTPTKLKDDSDGLKKQSKRLKLNKAKEENFELFKKDTSKLMNTDQVAKTIVPPKEKPMKKKRQSVPRGIKITEFYRKVSSKNDQSYNKNHGKVKCPVKLLTDSKESKTEEDEVSQKFDLKLISPLFWYENEDAIKSDQQTQDAELRNKFINQLKTDKKSMAKKYFKLVKNFKLNDQVLIDLKNYPIDCGENFNKNIYSNSELTLYGKTLFNHIPNGVKRLDLPSVTNVLDISMPIRELNGLIDWRIAKINALTDQGFQTYKKKTNGRK